MIGKPLSLREFARVLGVSDTAIRKAIASGRIRRGVGDFGGRPAIIDQVSAAEDWQAGRRQKALPIDVAAPFSSRAASAGMADVNREIAIEKLRKMRLDSDAREAKLLPVDAVERAQRATLAAVRGQLLAVPRRCVLAGLPPEHELLVRRAIVDALRELAEVTTLAGVEAQATADVWSEAAC
ncbi:MAG: hypothetical protein AB7L71_07770 [Vicinamibacterales bacterium]